MGTVDREGLYDGLRKMYYNDSSIPPFVEVIPW